MESIPLPEAVPVDSVGDRHSFDAELLSCRHGLIKGKVQVCANEQVIGQGEFQYASPHLMALPVLNFKG